MNNTKEMDYFQLFVNKENRALKKRLAESEKMIEDIHLKFTEVVSSLKSLGSSLDSFRLSQAKVSGGLKMDQTDEGITASEMWNWDASELNTEDQNIQILPVSKTSCSLEKDQADEETAAEMWNWGAPDLNAKEQNIQISSVVSVAPSTFLPQDSTTSDKMDIGTPVSPVTKAGSKSREEGSASDSLPPGKKILTFNDLDNFLINIQNGMPAWKAIDAKSSKLLHTEKTIENSIGNTPERLCITDGLQIGEAKDLPKSPSIPNLTNGLSVVRSRNNPVVHYEDSDNGAFEPEVELIVENEDESKSSQEMSQDFPEPKCQIPLYQNLPLKQTHNMPKIGSILSTHARTNSEHARTWTPPGALGTEANFVVHKNIYTYSLANGMCENLGLYSLQSKRNNGIRFLNQVKKHSPKKGTTIKELLLAKHNHDQSVTPEPSFPQNVPPSLENFTFTLKPHIPPSVNKPSNVISEETAVDVRTGSCKKFHKEKICYVDMTKNNPLYKTRNWKAGIQIQGKKSNPVLSTFNSVQVGQTLQPKVSSANMDIVPQVQTGYRFILPDGAQHLSESNFTEITRPSINNRVGNGRTAGTSPESFRALSGIDSETNPPILKTLLSSNSAAFELQSQYEVLQTPNPGTIELSCTGCWRSYKYFGTLSDSNLQELNCFECQNKLVPRIAIANDIQLEQPFMVDSKTLQCRICKIALTSQRHVEEHMKIDHGVKPFKCTVCGKLFREKRYLKSHSYIHVSLLPFQCPVCSKSFATPSKLRYHNKLVHTGEIKLAVQKRHKCLYCGIRFRYKEALRKHSKFHAAEMSQLSENGGNDFIFENGGQDFVVGNDGQELVVENDGHAFVVEDNEQEFEIENDDQEYQEIE